MNTPLPHPLHSLILQFLPPAETRREMDQWEETESVLVNEIVLIQPESSKFGKRDMFGMGENHFCQFSHSFCSCS